MKKIYCALAFAALAVAANAEDYYLIGGFNGWALSDANYKFAMTAEGVYELDYNGTLTSGFKLNDGTWDNENANFGSNGVSNLVVGQEYTLGIGSTSGNITMAENVVNPHIVFKPEAATLLVTGQTQEAKISYCLWGNFFGSDWVAIDLTENGGKWVSAESTVNACNFGIKKNDADSGSQLEWLSSAEEGIVTLNTALPLKVEGTNFSLSAGTYTFTLDPAAMTLTVTGEGGDTPEPPAPGDYTSWYVNVVGDFNNWEDNGLNPNAAGVCEHKDLAIGWSGFKVKVWDGVSDIWYSYNGAITPGQPTAITKETSETGSLPAMTIVGATESDVYNVTFDCATGTITITKVGGDTPEPPTPGVDYSTWYVNVIGDFNSWLDNGINPNAEGVCEHTDLAIGTSGFKIKVWTGSKDVYYSYDQPIVVGEPTIIYEDIYDMAPMTIADASEGDVYNVKFDCATTTLTITKNVSGVNAVVVASESPVYYNLQGVKVANPENGIYVKVVDGKATKVVL